jgi:ABC-type bacteriocin/lantibiotic exporter with double-glycine peptidase domain
MLVGGLCAAVVGIAASIDPLLMRHLLDYSLPKHQSRDAYITIGLIAACFLGRAVLSGFLLLSSFRTKQLIGHDLRVEILTHMTRLSAGWHEQVKLGEKISRLESDVEEISNITSTVVNILTRAGLFFIINIIIMYRLNAMITVAFLPVLPLFFWIRRQFRASIRRHADSSQTESGKALATLTEQLGAILQLELLGAGGRRVTRTVGAWLTAIAAQWRLRVTEVMFGVTVTSIFALAILLVLWLGIHEFLIGALSIGSLVAFYSYVGRIFDPISTVMDLYSQSQRMTSSLGRIEDVLSTDPAVLDEGTIHRSHPLLTEGITFRRVVFGYSAPLSTLRDISFQIAAGETIALVGKSGSGKSTLARLLVRLIDPTAGTIWLDGRELNKYSLSALREIVCYVPQHTILFAGTIRENLLYANPNVTDRQLQRAVKAAQLEMVVQRLPLGLDSELGPDGVGLSGGERQRLAIARAMLRDAAVLILDEATSALDMENERSVLEALSQFKPSSTLIVISHRLKSLQWVDRFVLLDAGKISAEGSHPELIATSALFRQLYEYGTDDESGTLYESPYNTQLSGQSSV